MAFDVSRRVIRIASPDASILAKLKLASVGHTRRHRYHLQFFRLRIEPHQRVAARATDPNLPRPPIDVYRVRNVVSLARKRIDFPLIFLWIVTAEVAAAVARYPHNPVARYLKPSRTVDRRLPLRDLARS